MLKRVQIDDILLWQHFVSRQQRRNQSYLSDWSEAHCQWCKDANDAKRQQWQWGNPAT